MGATFHVVWVIVTLAFFILLGRRIQLAYRDAVRFRIPLLDSELSANAHHTHVMITNSWYLAKPEEISGMGKWFTRIRHAWSVLRGRASAFQYQSDREK